MIFFKSFTPADFPKFWNLIQKKQRQYSKDAQSNVEFYPTGNNFTLALLVMHITCDAAHSEQEVALDQKEQISWDFLSSALPVMSASEDELSWFGGFPLLKSIFKSKSLTILLHSQLHHLWPIDRFPCWWLLRRKVNPLVIALLQKSQPNVVSNPGLDRVGPSYVLLFQASWHGWQLP